MTSLPISSILWQNTDKSISLIDVPHSISNAQSNRPQHYYQSRNLLSSSPLQTPYPSNEPKTPAAKAKIEDHIDDATAEINNKHLQILTNALDEIRRNFKGDWCQPRLFTESSSGKGKKRPLNPDYAPALGPTRTRDSSAYYFKSSEANASPVHTSLPSIIQRQGIVYHLRRANEQAPSIEHYSPFENFIENDNNDEEEQDGEAILSIRDIFTVGRESTFYLPPRSKFYLGDCTDSHSFYENFFHRPDNNNPAPRAALYDFILLDPPWPNRSVKRTHKTPCGSGMTTYATTSNLSEMRTLLVNLNLPQIMGEECLVGIWITNRPAIRNLILDSDTGIFTEWNVELVEEWLWVKTTVAGEPVFPLEGLWRKPYEVLLLGRCSRRRRRRRSQQRSSSTFERNLPPQKGLGADAFKREEVKTRVLVSVPDLHSRKPCVKSLIEPILSTSNPESYKALEVFARHLVAGWHSWGNECIRFNWEGCWRMAEQDTNRANDGSTTEEIGTFE